LAAVLVFGRRAFPAIAFSEMIIAFCTSCLINPDLGIFPRGIVAVGLGGIGVLQAGFGAWLIRKVVGADCPLTNEWDILKFLVLAGPVFTLLPSSLSVLVAYGFQTQPWQDFWSAVGERWWSAAVGGAIFTPITLAFIATPTAVWRPRRLTLALPLLIGAVAVVGILAVANYWDDRAVRRKLADDTRSAAAELADDFNRFINTLDRARAFLPYDWSSLPTGGRGRLFPAVSNFRSSYPFVTSVSLSYDVPHSQIESFREKVTAFTSKTTLARVWESAENGDRIDVRSRPIHTSVVVNFPDENAPWPDGFDLASDHSVRTILQTVRTTCLPALYQSDAHQSTGEWVVFVPLSAFGQSKFAARAATGFLVVGVDPTRLLARFDGSARTFGVRLSLRPPTERKPNGEMVDSETISLLGTEFQFLGQAEPAYLSESRTSLTWVVAGIGFGLSILLTALLLIVTGREAVVAEAVMSRTAALHAEIISRTEIEGNLRASETRLAEAQRIANLGAWEWDADPDAVAWTDELTMLIGPPPGPDPNLSDLLSYVRPEDRSAAEQLVRAAVEQSRQGEKEIRVRTASGQDRIVAFTVVPVSCGLPGRAVRGTLQDVTERRRFEDKLRDTQRLESLGVLAGGIAHDFNNLLTGILGNAALIREQLAPISPFHDSLRVIERSAEHAAALCQQMLTYAGRGPSVRTAVDLNRIIEESAELIRLSVHKKIDLRLELADGNPVLRADAGQLRQVLLNFVVNASEAIGGNVGRVTIRTGSDRSACRAVDGFHGCDRLPAGSFAWLEVEDTGCGMTSAVKARVFEPFFTTKFTGRGLGLSAVHGIVRGHKGEICLTSTPDQGSTFRIWLPGAGDSAELLIRTPPPHSTLTAVVGIPKSRIPAPPSSPVPNSTPTAPIGPDEVILVADDEPAVRTFAATALRTSGYAVIEAVDGYDAVAQVTDNSAIKGLVLDVTMPGMDGRDTLDLLARIRPDVPVVLMSGYSEHELQDLFTTGTVKGFVSKPFRPGDLIAFVQRAIARSNRIPAGR
jgi:signal transduction histidine kinase/CheY-like chemotaxis protein